MLSKQFPIHFFHAHGCAFGGEITKPFRTTIESQAATAISSVGGYASASASGFNLKELVQIHKASTQIAAIEEDDSYDTVVTCRLEGVNIFNQFTADSIVAHLSVKTPKKGNRTTFTTVGTRFENLRIGGISFEPELDHECEYKESKRHAVGDLTDSTGKEMGGPLSTLVANLNPKDDSRCVRTKGNAIHVADFGVVYLAEYLVTPNARQLNMFRIRFGCGVDGRASGGGVGANGQTCPPPT